jgi:uncharacterized Rmd1/YagE family protein
MEVFAHSLAESIDLTGFAADYGNETVVSSKRELFFPLSKNTWFSVYSFGAAAFCNVHPAEEIRIIELIRQHATDAHKARLSEDHTIRIGKAAGFKASELIVPKISDAVMRIVMQNMAYSVTLDHYHRVAANLLDDVKAHAAELEEKGKIRLREKNLNRFIGRVLKIKNRIAEHFYIFADLDIIWEDEFLTKVHRGTAKSMDLKVRFEEVENTFKIIEENLHMFNEFHMHGQSYRIEIIITLLIVIEVLDLIGDKFKLFH